MLTEASIPHAEVDYVAAGFSDVGLQRDHNEDALCILPEHRLFVVADGMGGHRAGDVASRMATQAISSFFAATTSADVTWPFTFDPNLSFDQNRLLTSIQLANRRIFEASTTHRDVHGMGTTIVGALYSRTDGRVYVAHVGDSRAYRIRGGQIEQLTRDHSLVNDYLLVMPDMSEAQRAELPTNVITRALGMQDAVEIDMVEVTPSAGDTYLLCSDGLNAMVSDAEILSLVDRPSASLESIARDLVQHANANGGDDNITVVIVRLV